MSKEKNDFELKISPEHIIERLKTVTQCKTITEIAQILGVSQSAISNWRRKNTIPWGLIFEKFSPITAIYILTNIKISPELISESSLIQEQPIPKPMSPDMEAMRNKVARLEGQLEQCRETNIQLLNTITELSKPVGTPSREKVSSH